MELPSTTPHNTAFATIPNPPESKPASTNPSTTPIPGQNIPKIIEPQSNSSLSETCPELQSSLGPLSSSAHDIANGLTSGRSGGQILSDTLDAQTKPVELHIEQMPASVLNDTNTTSDPPALNCVLTPSTGVSSISPALSLLTPPGLFEIHNPLSVTQPEMSAMSCTSVKPATTILKDIVPAPTSNAGVEVTPASKKISKRVQKPALKRTKKRKSGPHNDSDEDIIKAGDSSDSSDEPTPVATQTKSGRQIHRPTVFVPDQSSNPSSANGATDSPVKKSSAQSPAKKKRRIRKGKEVNITCDTCQRGHSPAGNPIVFCDDCNGGWHQYCHYPPIGMEVVNVKESQWYCGQCKPMTGSKDSSANGLNTTYEKAITATPYDSHFLTSQSLLPGTTFTQAQKLGYLSRLSHSALVALLVRVSEENPDILLFPSNIQDLHPSIFVSTPTISQSNTTLTSTTKSSSREPTMETPPLTSATSSLTPIASEPSGSTARSLPNDEDSSEDEFIEHRLYPQPGNGFRLPLDSVDLDILLEGPECTTFSHALHGPAKIKTDKARAAVGVA